jgi:hypothetical protein
MLFEQQSKAVYYTHKWRAGADGVEVDAKRVCRRSVLETC